MGTATRASPGPLFVSLLPASRPTRLRPFFILSPQVNDTSRGRIASIREYGPRTALTPGRGWGSHEPRATVCHRL